MKKTKYLILLALSIFVGCSPLKITPIHKGETIEKPGIVFYLPQTEINIIINLEKQNHIAGQFSREAQNLLPIKQKNSMPQWKITNIQLQPAGQPDSSHCYLLQPGKKVSSVQLNDQNILLGINTDTKQEQQSTSAGINNFSPEQQLPDYNNYFIKKNTRDIIDTIYTTVKRDSISYTKRSFVKKEMAKDKTDYANDIYKYLIKTRKRKFRIIAAMNDSSGNAESIKIRIQHLDSLEKSLKELITGKNIATPYTQDFHFLPSPANLTDTLAYFSNIYGINNHSGKPIIIKIIPMEKFTTGFSAKTKGKGLIYRIPQEVTVRLFFGNELVIEKQMAIAQMGQTLELPANILRNKNTSISYNPLTGKINNISNNK